MKKVSVFVVLVAFLMGGAMLNSCKNDELKELNTNENVGLKDMSDFALPIYMAKTTLIGHAEIYIQEETIFVDVMLDPALLGPYYAKEAHLYAGESAPPSNAPGQFPYHWYEGDPYPITFAIDISDWWDCEMFSWYFALHLELGMTGSYEEESAWLLPEEGGTFWLNKKGKPLGWGQYFMWTFDYVPVVSFIELLADAGGPVPDPPYWLPSGMWNYPVAGEFPDYSICLVAANPFYFFDIGDLTVTVPLETGVLNEFYLDEVADPAFWAYWQAKGVFEGCTGTWQPVMWLIISGDMPMLYVKWDGMDYTLIDGLQYQLGQGELPLRISGDYPPGVYGFTGTLMGENCMSEPFTIFLEVQTCIP